jgi:hypothetical protein
MPHRGEPASSCDLFANSTKGLSRSLPGLAGNARGLPEIPCLHFDRVDVEIGNGTAARFEALWRQDARIKAGIAEMQIISMPMRHREGGVAAANACQRVREIGHPMSDEMDNLALARDTAVDRHHAGRKDHPALPFCGSRAAGRRPNPQRRSRRIGGDNTKLSTIAMAIGMNIRARHKAPSPLA